MNIQQQTLIRISVLAMLGLVALLPSRADIHLFAGALGTNQNDKLDFSNGLLYDATRSSNYFPQILRTNGMNKGYYRGDVLTFTALAATVPNGGPIPGHAAFGSWLAVQVVSVAGPPGGSFAFWEGDGENDLGAITFSVPAGTTNGTNYFIVSENAGVPGSDPYGHIHGREFTASSPGTYTVGFRVIDLSTNGDGGGPIQSPSDPLPVRFQAGLKIDSIQVFTNRVSAAFRSPTAISNALEATGSIESGLWLPVAGPVKGNGNLQFLTETNAPGGNRFYRLRVLNNLP
ncbi:MAG TPA: hypothetical protein VNN22_26055 [Verrucomicrobiae bacterium]|nr:hypothetical protein [Verrucomicrobiae bacterium]